MRRDPYENRWRKKALLLAGVAAILAICIFVLAYKGRADKKTYEAALAEQEEMQKGEKTEDTKGTEAREEETVEEENSTEAGLENGRQENPSRVNGEANGQGTEREGVSYTDEEIQQDGMETISILNLDEYAKATLGENAKLLEQALASFVKDRHLDATEAVIFHVMVPMSDPQSIHYYVRLEDSKDTLALLAYHPRENLVTASICNYTEAEVMEEIWENSGPAQRDVPPGEAEALQQNTAQQESAQEGTRSTQESVSGESKSAEEIYQGKSEPTEISNGKEAQDGAFGKD